ncbi:MAG TPA: hypothetical protein VN957_24680, partial [Chthoniobacterales bacterium]|nr:hypothetical protein [Chthoniobacterales bacterium]
YHSGRSKALLIVIWLTSFISFFSLIYYSKGSPDQTKHSFAGGGDSLLVEKGLLNKFGGA